LLATSPTASFALFWLACLGSSWLNWILRSRLWFGHLGFCERLRLDILNCIVLLVLGKVANVGRILID